MSDYVNCPACKGRGVLPLEEAQRIEEHGQAGREAMLQQQKESDAAAARAGNEAWRRAGEPRTIVIRRQGPDEGRS